MLVARCAHHAHDQESLQLGVDQARMTHHGALGAIRICGGALVHADVIKRAPARTTTAATTNPGSQCE